MRFLIENFVTSKDAQQFINFFSENSHLCRDAREAHTNRNLHYSDIKNPSIRKLLDYYANKTIFFIDHYFKTKSFLWQPMRLCRWKKGENMNILGSWGPEARIGSGKYGDRFHDNINVYDQLLGQIAHVRNISFDRTKMEFNDTINYDKDINRLLFETKEGETLIKDLDSHQKSNIKRMNIANAIEKRIRGLKRLRGKYSEESSFKWIDRRVEELEKTKKNP